MTKTKKITRHTLKQKDLLKSLGYEKKDRADVEDMKINHTPISSIPYELIIDVVSVEKK